MAQVTLTIAGRAYKVACEDGHQEQVQALGAELERRAQALAKAAGAVSEGLLLVLVGIMLADEMLEAKQTTATAQETLSALQVELQQAQAAAEGQQDASNRLEEMERVRGGLNSALAQARAENALLQERLQASEQQRTQLEADHQVELDTLRGQMSEARQDREAKDNDLQANADALDQARQEVFATRQALDTMRGENTDLIARLTDAAGQEKALATRVGDLEGRLAEMKAALEAARMRLEHQHQQVRDQEQDHEAVAVAIENLAERIETVAECLSAP